MCQILNMDIEEITGKGIQEILPGLDIEWPACWMLICTKSQDSGGYVEGGN